MARRKRSRPTKEVGSGSERVEGDEVQTSRRGSNQSRRVRESESSEGEWHEEGEEGKDSSVASRRRNTVSDGKKDERKPNDTDPQVVVSNRETSLLSCNFGSL